MEHKCPYCGSTDCKRKIINLVGNTAVKTIGAAAGVAVGVPLTVLLEGLGKGVAHHAGEETIKKVYKKIAGNTRSAYICNKCGKDWFEK